MSKRKMMKRAAVIAAGRLVPRMAQRDRAGVAGVLKAGMESGRSVPISRTQLEGGAVRYAATLSSETPVMQPWGREILMHTPEAINMERAEKGLPLLFNHDTGAVLGRAKGISLVDGKLRAEELQFSQRADAQGYRQDVEDGILGDMSVRYTIDEYGEEVDRDGNYVVIVKRWTPLEVSITPIPADHSVGVGRQAARNRETPPDAGGGVVDMDAFLASRGLQGNEAARSGVEVERARVVQIDDTFAPYVARSAVYKDLRDHCVRKGISVQESMRALLKIRDEETGRSDLQVPDQRLDDDARRGFDVGDGRSMQAGRTALEGFRTAADFAVGFRAGLVENRTPEVMRQARENPFTGLRMAELAREYLSMLGLATRGLSTEDAVRYAITPWAHPGGRRDMFMGHGTSDFTSLLENNANKALMVGWAAAAETWEMIVRIGSLPDYKAGTRTALGAISSLQQITGNGEYKYATLSDVKEPIQLEKRGVIFALTREAIVNDDLDAFTALPRMMGSAANRAVGDRVYGLLTANAAMTEDAVTLFHANHNNIGSAGAPSVARLDEADLLLAKQKSPGNNEAGGLNQTVSKLILPRALKSTGQVLRQAVYDPAGTTSSVSRRDAPNIWANNFDVVSDARLDATSASVYYVSADPNMSDTLEVAFLNGNREPYLESRDGWHVDGIEWKIRHEFAAAVVGWRGLVRMPG